MALVAESLSAASAVGGGGHDVCAHLPSISGALQHGVGVGPSF